MLGIGTMQVLTYGPQTTQPVWDVATHAPQLMWDAAWLGILAASAFGQRLVVTAQPQMVKVRAR